MEKRVWLVNQATVHVGGDLGEITRGCTPKGKTQPCTKAGRTSEKNQQERAEDSNTHTLCVLRTETSHPHQGDQRELQ